MHGSLDDQRGEIILYRDKTIITQQPRGCRDIRMTHVSRELPNPSTDADENRADGCLSGSARGSDETDAGRASSIGRIVDHCLRGKMRQQ